MDEKDIEHRLTEVEARTKSNTHRLDNLDELVTAVKVLAVREENVENDVKEIKNDVKSLTSKPGKMWESMVEKAMLTFVAAVIGYVLAQIGF
jgi:hypothetical protein